MTQDTVIHNIYNTEYYFAHSLTVNGIEGLKVDYADICRNGKYCARIQDYWGKDIPRVYIEVEIFHTINEIKE